MIMKRNLILPVALVAALIGGSVGALVVHKQDTTADTPTVASTNPSATTPATYSDVSTVPANTSAEEIAANNSLKFGTAQEQLAYRDGFADGFLAARNNASANNTVASTYSAPRSVVSSRRVSRASSNSSSRVYYDYNNQPRSRSFWQKHRDKLTVAMGTGGGALLGGLIGGKKGAGIGALAGAGGSALYTYKLRNRTRRY